MEPRYSLLVESQGASSRKLEFSLARVVVGREQADLVLQDPQISTAHAELLFDGQSVSLRDLGSTNGTWCNNQRVATLQLTPGISVLLGQHRITFLGLVGAATGRGRTVAVQQAPQDWQGQPAIAPTQQQAPQTWQAQPAIAPTQQPAPQGWQAPPATAQPRPWGGPAGRRPPQAYPGGHPSPAVPTKKRSTVGTVLLVIFGLIFVGFLGLLGLGWYLIHRDTSKAAVAPSTSSVAAPPGGNVAAPAGNSAGHAEVTFGTQIYRGNTVVASIGKDRKHVGSVVEIHVAPSAAAIQQRSELLSVGLRLDRPGTYRVGTPEAAISFSLGDNEHYLAKPGVTVKIDRFDPKGEIEGTFTGDFEHELSGTVRETVKGKGSFLASFP
jgi:hypothetical protein